MTDITVGSIGDITPGTIFPGYATLPTHPQPKRRPFLALWKVGNNVIALPLTSLGDMDYSVKTAAEKLQRSTASYYPIAPNTNPPYLPVTASANFAGFIDLLIPMTLGPSSLAKKKSKGFRISAGDLRSVIMAHVGLVQCGQEAILTEQKEEESEMLLIDRRTYDKIRQTARDLLQRSEDLPHPGNTKEVTRSLTVAFDRPPAAKLTLPRLHYPTPSLGSSLYRPPPPPPSLRPQIPRYILAQRDPPQQQQQQLQQHRQPPNSQPGLASCRPHTFHGCPGDPDSDGSGDRSPGTRPRGSSNFYSTPIRSGNQGAQHQKEYQREKYQHNKDSNNKEDEMDEWTKRDRARAEEVVPEDEEKEKQLGEGYNSRPLFPEQGLAGSGKLEGLVPKITASQTSSNKSGPGRPGQWGAAGGCEIFKEPWGTVGDGTGWHGTMKELRGAAESL